MQKSHLDSALSNSEGQPIASKGSFSGKAKQMQKISRLLRRQIQTLECTLCQHSASTGKSPPLRWLCTLSSFCHSEPLSTWTSTKIWSIATTCFSSFRFVPNHFLHCKLSHCKTSTHAITLWSNFAVVTKLILAEDVEGQKLHHASTCILHLC